MLIRNTKWYLKDKYLKYDKNRYFIYKYACNEFNIKYNYIIENWIAFQFLQEKKYFSKKELIKKYWIEKLNSILIKKRINKINNYLNENLYLSWVYDVNNIKIIKNENLDKIKLENWIKIVKNAKIKITIFSNNMYNLFINFNDYFKDFEDLKENLELNFWKDKAKETLYNLCIDWKIDHIISDFLIEKLKKNKTLLSIEFINFSLDNETKKNIYLSLEDNLLFQIITESEKKIKLFKNKKINNEILEFFSIPENTIFSGNLAFQYYNKNKNLEKINNRNYYNKPAPKWYRKKENKIFKTKGNQRINKSLKNWNYELIDTITYKRNWNYYW